MHDVDGEQGAAASLWRRACVVRISNWLLKESYSPRAIRIFGAVVVRGANPFFDFVSAV